jgi:hypothetical protein
MNGKSIAGLAILGVVLFAAALLLGYAIHPDVEVVEKEVIKEVPVQVTVEKNITVEVDKIAVLKENALKDFLKDLKKDDPYICSGNEYDWSQISVNKIGEDVSIDNDDDTQTIGFEVKLKYKQDDIKQCYKTFDVEVTYEEGEKPVVSY